MALTRGGSRVGASTRDQRRRRIGACGRDGSGGDACAESVLTEPDEVARFVEETGVDALAVSIGTSHGVYRSLPNLAIDRLKELQRGQHGSAGPAWRLGNPGRPDPGGRPTWHLQTEYLRRLPHRHGTRIAASRGEMPRRIRLPSRYFRAHQGRSWRRKSWPRRSSCCPRKAKPGDQTGERRRETTGDQRHVHSADLHAQRAWSRWTRWGSRSRSGRGSTIRWSSCRRPIWRSSRVGRRRLTCPPS